MAFIIAVAVTVAIVWAIPLICWGRLVAGALAALVVGTLWGHPFFHVNLGPLPVTLDRVLLMGVLLVALVSQRWGWAQAKPLSKGDLLLGLFLGTLLIATFTHDWTSHQYRPVSYLVFWYLMPAMLYWIMRRAVWREREVGWVLTALSGLAVYLAATAVAEVCGWTGLVVPRYITSDKFSEFLGRGRGPLLNPVGNGLFITAGLIGLLLACFRAERGPNRLALSGAVASCLAGLYATLTRSVWMGASAGMALVVWQVCPPRVARYVLIGATIVGSCGVWSKWQNLTAFKRDKNVSVAEMSQSAELRPVLAAVAWRMFLDRPILGCGLGQYKSADREYYSERWDDLPASAARPYHQHNVFLALLTETGLVGAVIMMGLLVTWIGQAWRLWRDVERPTRVRHFGLLGLAVIVAYLINGMFHDVSVIPMVHALLFMLAGAIRGLAVSVEGPTVGPRLDKSGPERRNLRLPALASR